MFVMQPSDAPLKPHAEVSPPAFCVVEGVIVAEGGALGVGDENTFDTRHRFGE